MLVVIKQDEKTGEFLAWADPPLSSGRVEGDLTKVTGWGQVDAMRESGVDVTWDVETDAHRAFVERFGEPPQIP